MHRPTVPCLFFLLGGLSAGLASPARGQLLRGPEIVVNAGRTGSQMTPDVAVAVDGHSVVVWIDRGARPSVMARILGPDGTPRTGDLRVSNVESDIQDLPRVAMAADGSFVVVWQAQASEGAPFRVYGRRFDAGGGPKGERFPLGVGYHLEQSDPDVACAPDGRFVVAWTEDDGKFTPEATPMTDVLARRFAADGHPLGGDWTAAGGWYDQYAPAVSMNASGAFVIAYESYDETDAHDDGEFVVYAQVYGPDGTIRNLLDLPVFGGGFGGQEYSPSVALAEDGSLLLAWEDSQADVPDDENRADTPGILAQRFDAAGRRAGQVIHVNTTIARSQSEPSVSLAPNGYLIAWTSETGQDGDSQGIQDVFAQRLATDGSKVGPETALATLTAGNQSAPSVAVARNGRGVVVWQSEDNDGDQLGIAARRVFARR